MTNKLNCLLTVGHFRYKSTDVVRRQVKGGSHVKIKSNYNKIMLKPAPVES